LAYVRHRDYSASLGRFIELDPIGFDAGDNNWYRFVANRPTGKVDPSGLEFPTNQCRIRAAYDTEVNSNDAEKFLAGLHGVRFIKKLDDILADIIKRTCNKKACIEHLVIGAHGGQGSVGLEGQHITDDSITNYLGQLKKGQKIGPNSFVIEKFFGKVAEYLCDDATIQFHACKVGAGAEGEEFRTAFTRLMAHHGKTVTLQLHDTDCKWTWGGSTPTPDSKPKDK
jgi:hypothetical protein